MLKLPAKSLVVSTLFALSFAASATRAIAEEDGIISKEAVSSDSNYCHIKYMAFTEESLASGALEFDPSDVIDRYGSCDFDPKNPQEVHTQQVTAHRNANGDGGNDSSGD